MMAAPDFYFAVNAMFRYLHDHYGHGALVQYWRNLGRDYYRARLERWRAGGVQAIASDWRAYFEREPGADVKVLVQGDHVELDVRVCPAIKHLKDNSRDIVPYFCEHCDHICSAMAEAAGFSFSRTGGMGSCRQLFERIAPGGEAASC
jgi:hypothetical protein